MLAHLLGLIPETFLAPGRSEQPVQVRRPDSVDIDPRAVRRHDVRVERRLIGSVGGVAGGAGNSLLAGQKLHIAAARVRSGRQLVTGAVVGAVASIGLKG